jgi:hypothetical protein
MKLYLDVDGVILGKNNDGDIVLIPDIEKILRYSKENFHCYWLTTHGRYSTEDVLSYLAPFSKDFNPSIFKHIDAVRWNSLKTEAFDFSRPFIWIDDQPLKAEIQVLKKHACFRNWLFVDTYRNINDLTVGKIEERRHEILRQNQGKNHKFT